jgi:hypothetical protein
MGPIASSDFRLRYGYRKSSQLFYVGNTLEGTATENLRHRSHLSADEFLHCLGAVETQDYRTTKL